MSEIPASFFELLSPMRGEQFFDEFWERDVCSIRGQNPARFASWISEEQIRDFLAYSTPNLLEYDVHAVRHGAALAADAIDLLETGAQVRPRHAHRFLEAYAEGYTLVLRMLARRVGHIESVCRLFEKQFGCPVYPALYLTPPATQGFAPHWDQDDVYVFQLRGSKSWTVRANAAPLCRTSGEVSQAQLGELPVVLQTSLHSGDVLYIPRGFVHEASANDEASAHLTVSVSHPRFVDWIATGLKLARHDIPELRRSLPLGAWDTPEAEGEIVARSRALLARASAQLDARAAVTALYDSAVEKLSPAFGSRVFASVERWRQSARDTVELRLASQAIVAYDEATRLTVPAGSVTVPPEVEAPLRQLLAGQSVAGAALSSPEAERIVRNIVARGIIDVDRRERGSAVEDAGAPSAADSGTGHVSLPVSILDFGHPAATYQLAPRAEKLGYARYWLGEHHGPRQCASPLTLSAIVAGLTRRMRVGTAGVCLPLHGALRVAQQARLLELSFAHRIDIGVCKGMSLPQPVTRELSGPHAPWAFEQQLEHLGALLNASPQRAELVSSAAPSTLAEHDATGWSAEALADYMLATQRTAELWVLGVSPESAANAGHLGAYYCFSEHHNGGRYRAAEVLDRYRASFQPGPRARSPRTALVLGGICAESHAEARRLFEPIRSVFATPVLLDGPRACAERILAERERSTADEVVILDAFFARQDLVRADVNALRQNMYQALAEQLRVEAYGSAERASVGDLLDSSTRDGGGPGASYRTRSVVAETTIQKENP